MKRILVCGADGFMGRNIVEFFHKILDYDVYGTYHLGSQIKQNILKGDHLFGVDLTRRDHVEQVFSRVKPNIVIQAAANSSGVKDILSNPAMHVTDTLIMNALVTRACYDFDVEHFIFLSCGVMYQPGEESRREEDFNEHDDIYPAYFGGAWMKIYTEKACEFFSRLGKTKHTIIRHSNTYGPYDKYDLDHSHVFGATIRKVMDAVDGGTITVWGNGTETVRDLVYVEDVVNFMGLVIVGQKTPFELYNISLGIGTTVKSLVKNIIVCSGKNLNIEYDTSKPVIPTKLILNWGEAYRQYGWVPRTSIVEGIRKTIEWYKNYYINKS